MKKRLFCVLILSMLCLSPLLGVNLPWANAANGYSVHNVDTGLSYMSIQDAINANETLAGQTITVDAGTYFEHIVLNKTLALIGENNSTTVIDGQGTGIVVTIEADNVEMSGFTIQNSGTVSQSSMLPTDCGIKLSASSTMPQNATIENNVVKNNGCGIFAQYFNNNTIVSNAFSNNIRFFNWRYIINFTTGRLENISEGLEDDIFVLASNGSLMENDEGVVRLHNSTANTIVDCSSQVFLSSSYYNAINHCSGAISLSFSHNNTIEYCSDSVSLSSSDNNTMSHCSYGIKLAASNHNHITNNELSPGESIEVPDQSNHTLVSSCIGNTLADNVLTNGSINIGLRGIGTQSILSNDNTIANNTLIGGSITIIGSHNSVTQNKISGTEEAIHILKTFDAGTQPRNNSVSKNNVMNNGMGLLVETSNNEITENIIANNTIGLRLRSAENKLRNNRISGNEWNLGIESPGENDIDTTNTVNGDPVYCIINQSNIKIPSQSYPRPGYLALVKCSNVNVQGLVLAANYEGIDLVGCSNCTVQQTIIKNNVNGIILDQCSNCTVQQTTVKNNQAAITAAYTSGYITVANNTIVENYLGIQLQGACNRIENNIIMNNTIRLAPYRWPENWPSSYDNPFLEWWNLGLGMYSGGIFMWNAQNSTFTGNSITHNELGIFMYASSFNVFRNNTMTDNFQNFGVDPSRLYPPEWGVVFPFPNETSPYLQNDFDTTNTVNGKPIYWWINQHDKKVPTDAGYIFLANCTGIVISNLQLQNNVEGMLLAGVKGTVISDNTVTGCSYGIRILPPPGATLEYESNDTLGHNNITANGVGVAILAVNCTISHSVIDKNIIGILTRGDNNLIVGNDITHNAYPSREQWILGYQQAFLASEVYLYPVGSGIIFESSNNTACYNTIQNNDAGIGTGGIRGGGGNWIYQNNFIDNVNQTSLDSVNAWDADYPMGGNYWSDYRGEDASSGPYQNQTGSDAIGDTRYQAVQAVQGWRGLPPDLIQRILNQYDSYPLMAPVRVFDAGIWNGTSYSVDMVSNSTVSGFIFDPVSTGPCISFTVTGDAEATGFCRVAIPKNLLWACGNWTVNIGGQPANYTLIPDVNITYLMFSYAHSAKTAQIIGTHAIKEYTPFPLGSAIAIGIIVFTGILALAALLFKTRRRTPS